MLQDMYGINVRETGAVGDGVADDAAAIQTALDAGRGLVTIPYGVYKIGSTLRIGSHTRVQVHPQAHLFLADGAGTGRDVHLLTNRDHAGGDQTIAVEGGIWDGNNPANPRGPDAPDSYTGVLINFTNVSGLVLRNLTLRDPESYYIRLGQVRDFDVGPIRFEAAHLRPNQDGVHLGGDCEDGVIHDLEAVGGGVTGDDLVALNADDANERAQNLGKVNGPIRRVRVWNLRAEDCHTFVRVLSVTSPIEDIAISGIRGGCQVSLLNMDACRQCRVPLFDPDDPAFADGPGAVARLTLRDARVYKSSGLNSKALIDMRTCVTDLLLADITRDMARDANPGAPTLLLGSFQPAAVILEGMEADALTDATPTRVEALASIYERPEARSIYHLVVNETVQLRRGGFSRLVVNVTGSG